jgi:hypothetical protein
VAPGVAAPGVAAGVGLGAGALVGVGVALGAEVGRAVGAGVGLAVEAGVGFGVDFGVGAGVGAGGGAVIVSVPPAIAPLNLLVSAASKLKECVPTDSFVDHEWPTPCFQFELPSLVIVWAVPSMITATWSAAVPLRFRYVTANWIVVVGRPAVGDADGLSSFVGPSTARTGTVKLRPIRSAAQSAARGAAAGRPVPLRVRRMKCTR